MTRLRPLVVITAIGLVGVTGWAVFEEMAGGAPVPRTPAPANTATPAATAPPIRADAVAPHPDFGHCTRCHDVLPARGKADGVVPVASAPPILEGAALTSEQTTYLDRLGNGNGGFDLGDFLAWVVKHPDQGAAASSGAPTAPDPRAPARRMRMTQAILSPRSKGQSWHRVRRS